MPVVKVTDLAFGRLQSPSLDEAEEFLSRFGMVRADRTNDRLYMRGTDASPYIHVTHLGRSKVRDVDVRRRIGAAHVQAVVGALGAHHAEAGAELFGRVQARRLQPPGGEAA